MINIFCDKCKEKGKLRLTTDGKSILIECLSCGDAKRLFPDSDEVRT